MATKNSINKAMKKVVKKAKKMLTPKDETLHMMWMMKLQALYDVEQELTKALPLMAKHATDPELKKALNDHLKETEGHVKRLEKVFGMIDEKPKKARGAGIRGITADAIVVMKGTRNDEARDAGIIAAGAYAEHYEMAGYLSAIRWAEKMGHTGAVDLLTQNFNEEVLADEKLSKLAEQKIDDRVQATDDNEEEEEETEFDEDNEDEDADEDFEDDDEENVDKSEIV